MAKDNLSTMFCTAQRAQPLNDTLRHSTLISTNFKELVMLKDREQPVEREVPDMIISHKSNGVIDIKVITRQPMVYLDNWAISGVLANDSLRRKRFIDAFKLRGTLLFSWTNVLELPRYEPIKLLFDGIGEHWFPLEWNPFACIRNEQAQSVGENSPALSETFLQAYCPYIHGGKLTLSSVIDLLRRDNAAKVKALRDQTKEKLQECINELKSGHSADSNWLDIKFPLLPFDPRHPTLFVFTQLLRTLASETGFTFTLNDGLDLFHTTIPVAYSDFVLLDKAWAQRARAIAMPGRRFYAFYESEVDQFLDTFERCEIVSAL